MDHGPGLLGTGMVAKTPFEELVTPHLQAAFNLAYWIVRSREEAEDVVQDAYMRAFRAFSGFRGAAAKPWLLAIVRNVAYRALQNRKRAANVIFFSEDLKHRDKEALSEAVSAEPSAESALMAAEEKRRLLAALAVLSVDYREVIVLRELEGLTYNEIAEAIEAPVGTVMSRLSRARAELRERLARQLAQDEPNAL
jgi:RNA polymerase sigma-70 factor (ECF subfamily)